MVHSKSSISYEISDKKNKQVLKKAKKASIEKLGQNTKNFRKIH